MIFFFCSPDIVCSLLDINFPFHFFFPQCPSPFLPLFFPFSRAHYNDLLGGAGSQVLFIFHHNGKYSSHLHHLQPPPPFSSVSGEVRIVAEMSETESITGGVETVEMLKKESGDSIMTFFIIVYFRTFQSDSCYTRSTFVLEMLADNLS